MVWLWFLAGSIFGTTLGMMIVCAIVMDRKINDLEEE